jgi:hypothetical protein
MLEPNTSALQRTPGLAQFLLDAPLSLLTPHFLAEAPLNRWGVTGEGGASAKCPKLIFEIKDLRDDLPGFVGSTLALEEL